MAKTEAGGRIQDAKTAAAPRGGVVSATVFVFGGVFGDGCCFPLVWDGRGFGPASDGFRQRSVRGSSFFWLSTLARCDKRARLLEADELLVKLESGVCWFIWSSIGMKIGTPLR